MSRTLEVVVAARNALASGFASARAEAGRFASEIRRMGGGDGSKDDLGPLAFLTKGTVLIQGATAAARIMESAFRASNGELKEMVESMERLPMGVGELIRSTNSARDALGELYGIKNFTQRFLEGWTGGTWEKPPEMGKWSQDEQKKWFQQQQASMRAATASAQEALDAVRRESRLSQYSGKELEREKVEDAFTARGRKFSAWEDAGAEAGLISELRKDSSRQRERDLAAADRRVEDIERDRARGHQQAMRDMIRTNLEEVRRRQQAAQPTGRYNPTVETIEATTFYRGNANNSEQSAQLEEMREMARKQEQTVGELKKMNETVNLMAEAFKGLVIRGM